MAYLRGTGKHLEIKSKMDEALEMCQALEGCGRKQAEDIIAESYIAENAVAYEAMREEYEGLLGEK